MRIFQPVILVFRGVDPWDFAWNSGCQEASVALGLFWIGEYHKLQSSWWRGRGVLEVRGEFVRFFTRKIAPYNLVFFSKLGILQVRCDVARKKRSHALFLLIEWFWRKSLGFPRLTTFNLFFGKRSPIGQNIICQLGYLYRSSSWVIDVFLLGKMLPPRNTGLLQGYFFSAFIPVSRPYEGHQKFQQIPSHRGCAPPFWPSTSPKVCPLTDQPEGLFFWWEERFSPLMFKQFSSFLEIFASMTEEYLKWFQWWSSLFLWGKKIGSSQAPPMSSMSYKLKNDS